MALNNQGNANAKEFRIGDRASNALLNLFAVFVIAMVPVIALQVLVSRLGITNLLTFQHPKFLFGTAITLNSLTDLQWYLMAFIAIGPMAIVWHMDRHVRVDFAYGAFSERGRSLVELLGHAVYTLPFLIMCIPASYTMMMQAYARGEKSANAGLTDRFLVKGVVPFSLSLVLIIVLAGLLPHLRRLLKPGQQ
jgi:TRAP-type mannitol/chloroaromatic compound transport system permease small subunit